MLNRVGRVFCKVFLWRKSRRLQKLRRSPRVFVPTPSRFAIVVPFKTISLLLIVLLSLTSAYLLLRSDIFLVEKIEISWGQTESKPYYLDEIELRETLNQYRAVSILLLDTTRVEKELTDLFLPLGLARISKSWPDTLGVELSERQALAVLETVRVEQISSEERHEQRQRFLVDAGGLLFALPNQSESLPVFELSNQPELKIGDVVSGDLIQKALQVLGSLSDRSQIEIEKVTLLVGEEQIFLAARIPGRDVLWSAILGNFDAANGLKQQIHSLQVLVKEAKMEGKQLESVDLRYQPPVVRW